jgi:serine/threonine-protein kinase HipA
MTEPVSQLQVNVRGRSVGALGRVAEDASVFSYDSQTPQRESVSLTMPSRLRSYDWQRGVAPLFEMNLPEGALRAELQRRFSKTVRGFDDFALLAIVGPHQLGRVRIGLAPSTSLPTIDVAHLLTHDAEKLRRFVP